MIREAEGGPEQFFSTCVCKLLKPLYTDLPDYYKSRLIVKQPINNREMDFEIEQQNGGNLILQINH
jgi:hypothetical protein